MLVTVSTIVQSFMLVGHHALGGHLRRYPVHPVLQLRGGEQGAGPEGPAEIGKLCVAYTALLFLLARVAGPLFVALFSGGRGGGRPVPVGHSGVHRSHHPPGRPVRDRGRLHRHGPGPHRLLLSFFRKLVYFLALFIIPVFWEAGTPFGRRRSPTSWPRRSAWRCTSLHQQGPGPGAPGPVGRGIVCRPALTNAAVYETIPHIRKTRTRLWNRSMARTTRRSSPWSSM